MYCPKCGTEMETKCQNCGYEKSRSGCAIAFGIAIIILGCIIALVEFS